MTPDAGLRVLVSGGTSGIGRATAERFLALGARVAVLARDPAPAPEGTVGLACDVADDEAVRRAVEEAVARLGGLDVLVNNAAVSAVGTVEENPDDEWRRVIEINLLGVVRLSRAALPHLRRSPHAAIVNVASAVATQGFPDRALYTATKGAVEALTRAMAADHVREGIRVNAVSPGTVDTPWIARLLARAPDAAAELAALEARQPHDRLVTAAEVAEAICYLASPEAGSTTGAVLAVDGGSTSLRLRPR
jgi:NAD(P)-dependent dehydrogenase (short-subunit alcohol dehydrogenase family)